MSNNSDLSQIKSILKSVATKDDLKNLVTKEDAKKFSTKADLKPIKEDITKIRGSLNEIIGFFDDEYIRLRKRVERIEQHLDISPVI